MVGRGGCPQPPGLNVGRGPLGTTAPTKWGVKEDRSGQLVELGRGFYHRNYGGEPDHGICGTSLGGAGSAPGGGGGGNRNNTISGAGGNGRIEIYVW